MRRIFFLTAMLLAASLFSACEPAASNNTVNKAANTANTNAAPKPAADAAAIEAEIRKVVNDGAASLAKNDVAALEKMYDDSYLLVNLDGSIQNRSERLASFKSGETKFDSFSYDEVNVRSNPEGTGAIVIARGTATGTNKGQKVEGKFRVTQVWRKYPDGWKQVTGHATRITGETGAPATNSSGSANSSATPAGNANSGK